MQGDGLDTFIGEIIHAKHLIGVTEEVRAQLIRDLRDRLLDQINRAIIESLPDDKLDEFNARFNDNNASDEDLQSFINESGIDTKKIAATTMLRFRDLYLQTSKERGEQGNARATT